MIIDDEISLRLFIEEDAERYFEIIDRNRQYFCKWFPWENDFKSINEVRKLIAYNNSDDSAFKHLAIFYLKTLVGGIGHEIIDHIPYMMYWLDKDYQDRLIVTRSIVGLTNQLINQYGEVRIICDPKNVKSISKPNRLGFKCIESTDNKSCYVTRNKLTL